MARKSLGLPGWVVRRKQRPSGTIPAQSRVVGLERLEERIMADANSAGVNGINALGLTTESGAALTGKGVVVGMVEPGRPGKIEYDTEANVNVAVTPEYVFVENRDADVNEKVDSHAEGVAGVIVGKGDEGGWLPMRPCTPPPPLQRICKRQSK
jgi:hypothetical protein